jgi:hypothetical protein
MSRRFAHDSTLVMRALSRSLSWMTLLAALGCDAGSHLGVTSAYDCTAGISTDAVSYAAGDSVTVTWSCTQGHSLDWVTIVPAGGACTSAYGWALTGGTTDGSHVFHGSFAPGSWVARFYPDYGCTVGAESAPFTVTTGPAVVSADASAYVAGNDVVVSWNHLPGNYYDWVGISHVGTATNRTVAYVYTAGAFSGTHTFHASDIGNGTFEVRAFANGGYALLATSASFTISGVSYSLTTDHSTYAFGDPVVASWSLNVVHA